MTLGRAGDNGFDAAVQAMAAGQLKPEPRIGGHPIVLYRTAWKRRDDGWSIMARAHARAMHLGGIDVRLTTWAELINEPAPAVDIIDEVRDYLEPPRDWDAHLFSAVLGSAAYMRQWVLGPQKLARGPQVFHAMFERQYLEPDLVDDLNGVTAVWATCSANRDVLKRSGVRRVKLIYFPYFDDDPRLKIPVPRESRRFLWVGRSEPRKAPDMLIRAFLRAFRPHEATLTLKLSPYAHPTYYASPEEVMLHELYQDEVVKNGWTPLSACACVRIVRGRFTAGEMVALHANHDVYASASRGEGLDLPAFAAKLAGRKLVVTDSGGPRDFLNDGDVLVPATGVIEADPSYTWGPGATYADYRLDDLIAALQSARSKPPPGSRVPPEFRADRVGKQLRDWILELTGA